MNPTIRSTTVLGLTHQGKTVIGSDGQVTVGQTVMKHNARKVRKLYNDRILAGFAGAAADAFTLFGKFEDTPGETPRATLNGRRSSWQRNGGRTNTSASWKPCWQS